MYCPNPHDRAGNRMRRTDWNSSQSCPEKSQSPGAFGTEPAKGFQLSNFRAHGMDNTPSAKVSARSNGAVGPQNNEPFISAPVVVHVISTHVTRCIQRASNYSHRLLSVVATMPQAVCCRRNQLQFSEPCIHV